MDQPVSVQTTQQSQGDEKLRQNSALEAEARALMAEIPVLAEYQGPLQRLGGLTNATFHAGDYVLRLPGKGTEEYIDRKNELRSFAEAARVGVAPELVHFDPETAVMVTRLVQGAVTLTPEKFRTIPGAAHRAGEAFRKLHRSDAVFPARFELFAMIDEYLAVLKDKPVALPEGYHDVVAEAAGAVRAALARHEVAPVACHCDPLCENLLDTGERIWIVDWEYSGMNDPMWDLGDLSVEGGFSPEQDAELLSGYFGGPAPAQDEARMVIYKAMCDLLWTLWGLIQVANENPLDDFSAYAEGRFARCRSLMAAPEFAKAMAVLAD